MTLYGQRPPPPPSSSETPKSGGGKTVLGLSGSQIAAGALAASTSAVAASYLGAVGTVIGAGVGSVIATVSTAVYQSSLKRSAERLQRVVPTLTRRERVAGAPTGPPPVPPTARGTASVGGPPPEDAAGALTGLSGTTVPMPASDPTRPIGSVPTEAIRSGSVPSGSVPTGAAATPGATRHLPVTGPAGLDLVGTRWWDGLPWKRIAAVSAVVFVLSLAVVSVIELIDGRPLSALLRGEQTTGTTIGGTRDDPTSVPTDTASPDVSAATEESPSAESTTTAPAETVDPSPTSQSTTEPTTSPSAPAVPTPPGPGGGNQPSAG